VSADGRGLVSQAGAVLLWETMRVTGLARGLSEGLGRWRAPRAVHDQGKVVADLAAAVALGGDCLADIAVLREQPQLAGPVASDPVVSRLVSQLAGDLPRALKAIRSARAAARERAWGLAGDAAPGASGNGEPLAIALRPGNAGSNTAADHWPAGMRVIVRKERPHPGAQLRFTDVDGHRFTAFATNAKRGQLAALELRHRRRARCEDRIRCAKGRTPGARGTPPTRRDSRAASHGRHPKSSPSRTDKAATSDTRNIEVRRPITLLYPPSASKIRFAVRIASSGESKVWPCPENPSSISASMETPHSVPAGSPSITARWAPAFRSIEIAPLANRVILYSTSLPPSMS